MVQPAQQPTQGKRGISKKTLILIAAIAGGVLVLCCGMGAIGALVGGGDRDSQKAAASPSPDRTSASPSPMNSPSPSLTPASPSPQPPPAPSPLVTPPGFPSETAKFLNIKRSEEATFAGMKAYQMTLEPGGPIWAIPGEQDTIVPKVLKDPAYNENGSLLFRSGSYVIFMPSLVGISQLDVVGPKPGMTLIDTDPYRCADPTIPGAKVC